MASAYVWGEGSRAGLRLAGDLLDLLDVPELEPEDRELDPELELPDPELEPDEPDLELADLAIAVLREANFYNGATYQYSNSEPAPV